ncbi:MAG: 3-methyl-2-oxobutanoate hydroxymethyltransferase [Gammaproteobacteria bacterium]|nr:3-methyl-2-oxobutanoate hydroxymethyltransferase [Gammaproteobacteria bacterium]MCZ6880604.1 3-methyl-2-oxobutanoate hydroxymethyltransferase [Gammaproteobacteria bacterium]
MYTHLQQRDSDKPPVTISTLEKMKAEGTPIACLTAYDASFANLVDEAGVDLVLAGDSLGMVIQGHPTTVPVTVDDIVYHCKAVARGLTRSFLVGDLPFLSYTTPKQAMHNSRRLMQEGRAKMVKLEGGAMQVEIVEYLASRDVPVCAHIGLKPQSVHKLGGYKIQGRDKATAKQMLADARALENAGADIVLLECIPNELGARITRELKVPVIGIGAGPDVDGQILVLYDILNITIGRKPRFAQDFTIGGRSPIDAVKAYVEAVRSGDYPAPEHCFS